MTRNEFLIIVREAVVEARTALKKAYCVQDDQLNDAQAQASCSNIGKRRILKYTEGVSDKSDEFYRNRLAKLIRAGTDTPVHISTKEKMTTKWGTHFMVFYPRLEKIAVLNTLPRHYESKYGTIKGLRKYVKYTLFHEFGHAIEKQLSKIQVKPSETKAYRQDVERITSKGEGGSKYFSTEHMDEIFAEWSNIQDLLGDRPIKILDVKILCLIKRRYPKGGRIKWKASQGLEITELDYAMQSPLIQSFINCSDIRGTFERLNSMGLKVNKSELS